MVPRLACLLSLALTSCAALTTIDPQPRTKVQAGPVPVAGTPLFDWKGIVHCHSHFSHDSDGQLDEILAACDECGIRFVAMTDHQTEASVRDGVRGMRGHTLFLVGAEVRAPQGTLLAFPLLRPLRRWQHVALLAKEAAAQGALTFVCHAETWHAPWDIAELTGAEIVNLHAGAMTRGYGGSLATALFLPLRSLLERICVRDAKVLAEWDRQLVKGLPYAPVGGADAHANVQVFGPLGGTVGSYREVFSTLSTHVLAERLDEASIVDAFRRGRSYVSFDIFGEGTGFDFRAERGAEVVLVGDEIATGPTVRLRVTAPAAGHIRLFRDGAPADERTGRELVVEAPAAGIYRVEVETTNGDPWLFSSSIRVVDPR
ncbi:MAG: hypothetical protein JNM25_19595 [Planctomycetes bacterium]|nr:hypothetical protein [Planctomycetota bacterium]